MVEAVGPVSRWPIVVADIALPVDRTERCQGRFGSDLQQPVISQQTSPECERRTSKQAGVMSIDRRMGEVPQEGAVAVAANVAVAVEAQCIPKHRQIRFVS